MACRVHTINFSEIHKLEWKIQWIWALNSVFRIQNCKFKVKFIQIGLQEHKASMKTIVQKCVFASELLYNLVNLNIKLVRPKSFYKLNMDSEIYINRPAKPQSSHVIYCSKMRFWFKTRHNFMTLNIKFGIPKNYYK